ncbi:hypothetical protein K2X33_10390, partial [bacterium]|nr:hypothetical protein [bacterium]
MARFTAWVLGFVSLAIIGCGGGIQSPGERTNAPSLLSPAAVKLVADIRAGKVAIRGKAQIALLYYQDQPAHRDAVLAWLEKNKANLGYEDTRFGYVDAQVEWSVLEKLIETRGDLG